MRIEDITEKQLTDCADIIVKTATENGYDFGSETKDTKKIKALIRNTVKDLFRSSNEETRGIVQHIVPKISAKTGMDEAKLKMTKFKDFCDEGSLRSIVFKVEEKLCDANILQTIQDDLSELPTHYAKVNAFLLEWLLKPCSEAYAAMASGNVNTENVYMQVLCGYGDQPMFKFLKEIPSSDKSGNNSFFYLYQTIYGKSDKRMFSLSYTTWFQEGVFKKLLANYKTKLSSLAPSFERMKKEDEKKLSVNEAMMYRTLISIESFLAKRMKAKKEMASATKDFKKSIEEHIDSLKDKLLKEKDEGKAEKIESKIRTQKEMLAFFNDNKESVTEECEKNIIDAMRKFLKEGGIHMRESQPFSTSSCKSASLTAITNQEERDAISSTIQHKFLPEPGFGTDPILKFTTPGATLYLKNNRLFQKLLSSYVKSNHETEIGELMSDSLSYARKNGSLYVTLQFTFPEYEKPSQGTGVWYDPYKRVGWDVNISHAMLVGNRNSFTEYTDGKPLFDGDSGLGHGYVNLYREMLETGLLEISDGDTMKAINGLSSLISVGVIEYGTIVENALESAIKEQRTVDAGTATFSYIHLTKGKPVNKDYISLRRAMRAVRDMHAEKSSGKPGHHKYAYDYAAHNHELLNEFSSYIIALENLRAAQQAFDTASNFGDSFDFRRRLEAFSNTETGTKLHADANKALKRVQDRTTQIKRYAFNALIRNGIVCHAFEQLESSQMKNRHKFPSEESILSHFGFGGLTELECARKEPYDQRENNPYTEYVSKKGYYTPTFTDGKLSSLSLTAKGERQRAKGMLWSRALPAIKFAASKDVATIMSSDSELSVRYVNMAYTSQLDSKTGSVYMEEVAGKHGKGKTLVITDKGNVRPSQYEHVNGMNADANAGGNVLNAATHHADIFVDNKSIGMQGYRKPDSTASTTSHFSIPKKLKEKENGRFVTVMKQPTEKKNRPAKTGTKTKNTVFLG